MHAIDQFEATVAKVFNPQSPTSQHNSDVAFRCFYSYNQCGIIELNADIVVLGNRGRQGGMPVVEKGWAVLASLILATSIVAQDANDDLARLDAGGHYQLAVEAVGRGDLLLAADHLEQYCSLPCESSKPAASPTEGNQGEQPSCEQRWLAYFHLAELYAHTARPALALEALRRAIECVYQAADPSSAPSLEQHDKFRAFSDFLAVADGEAQTALERWTRIAENSAQRLTSDELIALDRYVTVADSLEDEALQQLPRWRQHRERMTFELARQLETSDRFSEATRCYRRLIDEASITDAAHPAVALQQIHGWQQAYVRNSLKLAREARTASQHRTAYEQLKQVSEVAWLSSDHRQLILLARVDQLVALNRSHEALRLLGDSSTYDADPNLALRRAELLAAVGRKLEALESCLAAINEYPAYPLSHALHYLAGRLYISRADFAAARHHLAIAAMAQHATTEAKAKAQWMIGETYFLQQQYAAAIEAYQLLPDDQSLHRWHARALLQTAKCRELQGLPSEAVSSYRAFINLGSQQSEFAQELELAHQRISQLSSLPASQASTTNRDSSSLNR